MDLPSPRRWRGYYGVDNIFMENIEIHNPHTTILDVCALLQHRCRLALPVHDNSFSDEEGGHKD